MAYQRNMAQVLHPHSRAYRQLWWTRCQFVRRQTRSAHGQLQSEIRPALLIYVWINEQLYKSVIAHHLQLTLHASHGYFEVKGVPSQRNITGENTRTFKAYILVIVKKRTQVSVNITHRM